MASCIDLAHFGAIAGFTVVARGVIGDVGDEIGVFITGIHGTGDAIVTFRIGRAAVWNRYVLTTDVRVTDIKRTSKTIIAISIGGAATLDQNRRCTCPAVTAIDGALIAIITVGDAVTAVGHTVRRELALVVNTKVRRTGIGIVTIIIRRAAVRRDAG